MLDYFLTERVTYVINLAHDLHLGLDLSIQLAILHEFSLLNLLGCKWYTVVLARDLVHNCKRALTSYADSVVLVTAVPLSTSAAACLDGNGRKQINLCVSVGMEKSTRVRTGSLVPSC